MSVEKLPQDKIDWIYQMIMSLSIPEQQELLALLGGGGDPPDIGVREPRRPHRPSSSSGAVAELEDR